MENTTENKVKVSTLEYVDFNDIEEFICKELEIEHKYFRDYHKATILENGIHKVIGGKYKDLWHVWMSLNYDNVSNDTYVTVWLSMMQDALDSERMLRDYGDWIECLRKPLEKLQDQLGDDIVVYYSW
jgi:hypothetical protein